MTETSVFDHPLLDEHRAASLRLWVEDRGSRQHLVPDPDYLAVREIGLLRDILEAELRQQEWTLGQVRTLAGSLHGVIPDLRSVSPSKPPGLWHDVRDSLNDHDDDATDHTEDEVALLARLADLGPTAEHALVDAISRWLSEKHDHSAEGWAKVGVRIVGTPEADGSGI